MRPREACSPRHGACVTADQMTNRRSAAACVEANNFGAINLMMDVVVEGFAALEAPAGGVLPAVSTAEYVQK